jgi:hypothetical protein
MILNIMSLLALQGRPNEDKIKSKSNLILLSTCLSLVRNCIGVRDGKLGINCYAYGTNVNGQ